MLADDGCGRFVRSRCRCYDPPCRSEVQFSTTVIGGAVRMDPADCVETRSGRRDGTAHPVPCYLWPARLRRFAASARQSSPALASEGWCERGDSNPHALASASPSSWCVCQFRHFRVLQRFRGLAGSPAGRAGFEWSTQRRLELDNTRQEPAAAPDKYMAQAGRGQTEGARPRPVSGRPRSGPTGTGTCPLLPQHARGCEVGPNVTLPSPRLHTQPL
jgi:hypothetical protein